MNSLDVRKEYACARPFSRALHLDSFEQPAEIFYLLKSPHMPIVLSIVEGCARLTHFNVLQTYAYVRQNIARLASGLFDAACQQYSIS